MSSTPVASSSRADASLLLQVLSAPSELRLTLDNGLIYPPPPSKALYHLPRVLTWSGNEIFLFRSLPAVARSRNLQPARDLALYTMRRTPFTHEIALLPRREGLKGAIMRGRRSLLEGRVWEVETKNELVLRYARGKWKDAGGTLVAEELPASTPTLTIAASTLEVNMKDLIVVAWMSRLWQDGGRVSLTKSLLRREDPNLKRSKPSMLGQWRAFRDG